MYNFCTIFFLAIFLVFFVVILFWYLSVNWWCTGYLYNFQTKEFRDLSYDPESSDVTARFGGQNQSHTCWCVLFNNIIIIDPKSGVTAYLVTWCNHWSILRRDVGCRPWSHISRRTCSSDQCLPQVTRYFVTSDPLFIIIRLST